MAQASSCESTYGYHSCWYDLGGSNGDSGGVGDGSSHGSSVALGDGGGVGDSCGVSHGRVDSDGGGPGTPCSVTRLVESGGRSTSGGSEDGEELHVDCGLSGLLGARDGNECCL